jgi:hypothetical protein
MNRLLASCTVVCLALGCGPTPETVDQGDLTGANGGSVTNESAQYAEFDDLGGSFATQSGLQATFSGGALVETTASAAGVATLSSRKAFTDSSGAVVMSFTSPTGATGQLTLSGQLPDATPGQMTFSCANPGPGQSLAISMGILTGSTNYTYIANAGGSAPPEGSCTFTISSATLVEPAGTSSTDGLWGLHGTLSATLVNYENTTQTATFSATF